MTTQSQSNGGNFSEPDLVSHLRQNPRLPPLTIVTFSSDERIQEHTLKAEILKTALELLDQVSDYDLSIYDFRFRYYPSLEAWVGASHLLNPSSNPVLSDTIESTNGILVLDYLNRSLDFFQSVPLSEAQLPSSTTPLSLDDAIATYNQYVNEYNGSHSDNLPLLVAPLYPQQKSNFQRVNKIIENALSQQLSSTSLLAGGELSAINANYARFFEICQQLERAFSN